MIASGGLVCLLLLFTRFLAAVGRVAQHDHDNRAITVSHARAFAFGTAALLVRARNLPVRGHSFFRNR